MSDFFQKKIKTIFAKGKLQQQLSYRLAFLLITLILLTSLITTVVIYKTSQSFRTRERTNHLISIAHTITPLIARFDLSDIDTVLADILNSNKLLRIELLDAYDTLYVPEKQLSMSTQPDLNLDLNHFTMGNVGKLNIWWGADPDFTRVFLTSLSITMIQILVALSASWFILENILKKHVTSPIVKLRDHIETYQTSITTPLPPNFNNIEFNDLVSSFKSVWDQARIEADKKEKALEMSRNELEKRLRMTVALENILTTTDTLVCYYSYKYSQNAVKIGVRVPYEIEIILNSGDTQLSSVINKLKSKNIEHTVIHNQLSQPISLNANDNFTLHINTSNKSIWSVVCAQLDKGGRAFICTDITEQAEVYRLLQVAKKMEAVGVLTSGVAHDFNNILAIISNSLELVKLNYPELSAIDIAMQASTRGAKITKQLLDISRSKTREIVKVDQRQTLLNLKSVLPATIGTRHLIEYNINTETSVIAEEDLLETTLINLAMNARDAMPDGGTIKIAVLNASTEEKCLAGLNSTQSFIAFEVHDSGIGISTSEAEKLFDPFFTTKQKTGGTGLGLSMAQAFSSRSGGTVTYKPAEKGGSIFTLFLLSVKNNKKKISQKHASSCPVSNTGNDNIWENKHILIIDDESNLRNTIAKYLSIRGCNVSLASGFIEFKDLLINLKLKQIDLILCDMHMPDGTGIDVFASLPINSVKPIRVIMSGNTQLCELNDSMQSYVDETLLKPFRFSELDNLMRKHFSPKLLNSSNA